MKIFIHFVALVFMFSDSSANSGREEPAWSMEASVGPAFPDSSTFSKNSTGSHFGANGTYSISNSIGILVHGESLQFGQDSIKFSQAGAGFRFYPFSSSYLPWFDFAGNYVEKEINSRAARGDGLSLRSGWGLPISGSFDFTLGAIYSFMKINGLPEDKTVSLQIGLALAPKKKSAEVLVSNPPTELAPPIYGDPVFKLQSQALSAGTPFSGPPTALCLAVDSSQKVSTPPIRGVTQTGYPLVLRACSKISDDINSAEASGLWMATKDRQLMTRVNGQNLCMTYKKPIDKWISPLVSGINIPFVTDAVLSSNYPVLVTDCNTDDGNDTWQYDDLTQTVATFSRLCVSIYVDPNSNQVAEGLPAVLSSCDSEGYSVANTPYNSRFKALSKDPKSLAVANYGNGTQAELAEMLSGKMGLPIVGMMGKCMTVDRRQYPPQVNLSECDNRREQDFFFDNSKIKTQLNDCLRADSVGSLSMSSCSLPGTDWKYHVTAGDPNPKWADVEQYAQIRTTESEPRCLSVAPEEMGLAARRNSQRVSLVANSCDSSSAKSWYHSKTVRNIWVTALMISDKNGKRKPLITGEQVKETLDRINLIYRRMGIRFLFSPAKSIVEYRDTTLNQIGAIPMIDGWDQALLKLEAYNTNALYGTLILAISRGGFVGLSEGRSTISNCETFINGVWNDPLKKEEILTKSCGPISDPKRMNSVGCTDAVFTAAFPETWPKVKSLPSLADLLGGCDSQGKNCGRDAHYALTNIACYWGGGSTGACRADTDPQKMKDPVGQNGCEDYFKNFKVFAKSKTGLPAVSSYVWLGIVDAANLSHEFGHHFGLPHTFSGNGDSLGDTPVDNEAAEWSKMGYDICGNHQSSGGAKPDRMNVMNYFFCMMPRSLRGVTPMQLAKMDFVSREFPNRSLFFDCSPTKNYDGGSMMCVTDQALNVCKKFVGEVPGLVCSPGP